MGSYYHFLEFCRHRNAGPCPPPPHRQFLVELDCLMPRRRTICLYMSCWGPSSYDDKGYSTHHGSNTKNDYHGKYYDEEVVFNHHPTPRDVMMAAIRRLGLNPDRFMRKNFGFRLMHGTQQLGPRDVVPEAPDVVKLLMVGLVGGKGGFGAALRAMAKQAGDKKTTDFGACRDLQGRRLRHVNNEIRLQKWKEERDRTEQSSGSMSTSWDEETPTGIQGWHLGAPSWADGLKKKSSSKVPRKSWMCKDWVMARLEKKAPDGAPPWWGCPRGRNCNFAHGEEELRGQGASQALMMKKDIERFEICKSLDNYVSGSMIKETQENMSDAVAQGMATAKLGKWRKVEDNGHQQQKTKALALPVALDGSADPSSVAKSWPGCSWLRVVSGEALSAPDGRLLGISSFATIVVADPSTVCSGCWYLEITMKSSTGRVQVGWADSMMFQPDSITGDGVGDDLRSWAFDGSNNPSLAWNGEEDEDKAKEYGRPWVASDVVGCLIDTDKREIAFHINGDPLGVAFRDIPHSESGNGYLAAVSLEDGEMVAVNIGISEASSLLFGPPEGYKPLGEAPQAAANVQDSSKSEEVGTVTKPGENPSTRQQMEKEEEDLNSYPPGPVDLDRFDSPSDLMACGLIRLRDELKLRGCKSGGTLYDRAARLYSLKDIEPSQYPPEVLFTVKGRKKGGTDGTK